MLSTCKGSFVKWSIVFASLSDGASTTGNTAFQDKGFDPTGWELALVTAPSNTTSSTSVGQLVCFFNLHICFFLVFMFSLHVEMLWHLNISRLLYLPHFFCILALFLKKKIRFSLLEEVFPFLDPLLSALCRGAEVTRLGATSHGAKVLAPLSCVNRPGGDVAELGAIIHDAELPSRYL
jgi:hypothetical protein